MHPKQKIITTVLWSFLVLTMLAVVGLGMWQSNDAAPAASGISISTDAPTDGGLPMLFNTPQFSLTDQNNQPFGSDQLKGQVWVAAFIFTKCANACPMMTRKMAALQEAVPAANVKLVSFSVDPARDTPGVLKEYAKNAHADESRWHFLTGNLDAILLAADGMKLSVKRPIDHAEKFLLVDTTGRVRGVYDSNDDQDLKKLARHAAKLAGV
jgi:protein SCO1